MTAYLEAFLGVAESLHPACFFKDHRMQSITCPLRDAWVLHVQGVLGVNKFKPNDEVAPCEICDESQPGSNQSIREIREFVHFIVESDDEALMKDGIKGVLSDLGVGVNETTGGSLRISHFDCSIDREPSAAYSKSHDPFTRTPGLNRLKMSQIFELFEHYRDPEIDVFLAGDSGQHKVRSHIYRVFLKQWQGCTVGSLELIPKQADQERRRHHSKKVVSKKQNISGLSTVTGREGFLVCHKTKLDARPHKYLTCQVFPSSSSPVMIIPLLDPEDLAPRVTQDEKRNILCPRECAAEMVQDGKHDTIKSDANLEDMTWLFTFDKHPSVYQELLWM